MNGHSTTNDNDNAAADTSKPVPLWIAGKQIQTETTFPVTSPTTTEHLWTSSSVSVPLALEALDAAQTAFKTWRHATPATIRKILLKAADIFETRQDELAGYMKAETGALANFAGFNTTQAIEVLRDVAGRSAHILGEIPKTSTPGTGAFIFKEPYGVIFGAAPWNAPYILGLRAFIYAIAAGNTVVLKGSELSPRTFWALGSVMKEAGLPDGVLSVIYHRPEDAVAVTNAIIESAVVKKVISRGARWSGRFTRVKLGKS